jgi:hypothetical protein
MTLGNVTQSQIPLYIYFAIIDGLSSKNNNNSSFPSDVFPFIFKPA